MATKAPYPPSSGPHAEPAKVEGARPRLTDRAHKRCRLSGRRWLGRAVPHPKSLLCLFPALATAGCSVQGHGFLDPQGPIALSQRELLLTTFGLMLIVLVPVFIMTFWFPWKYRASNTRAMYAPKWSYSPKIELIVWLVPALIVAALGTLTWIYTHRLSPYQPLDTGIEPLEVQVIALDWKWLFIYPQQDIAVVNQLVFPARRPVHFDITSDTVMNAFFIPQLGGQIYAMAGMKTQLSLMATEPGSYFGENTQYSGRGFPYQHFEAIAKPSQEFAAWVNQVKRSPTPLDASQFRALEKPSVRQPVTYYSSVAHGLFHRVMEKFVADESAHKQ